MKTNNNLLFVLVCLFTLTSFVTSLSNNNNQQFAENGKYIVKRGDCLYNISKSFNVSIHDLKVWNKIKNVAIIQINQELFITNPNVVNVENQNSNKTVTTTKNVSIPVAIDEDDGDPLMMVLDLESEAKSDTMMLLTTEETTADFTMDTASIDSKNLEIDDLFEIDSVGLAILREKSSSYQMIQLAIKYNIKFNIPGDSKRFTLEEIAESMDGKIVYSMGRKRYSAGPKKNGQQTFYSDCSGFTALIAGLFADETIGRTTAFIFKKAKRIDSDDLDKLPIGTFAGWPPSDRRHGHVYVKISKNLWAHTSSSKKGLAFITEETMQKHRGSYSIALVSLPSEIATSTINVASSTN
jgi:LysM repeat protein